MQITLYHPGGQTMKIDDSVAGYYMQNYNWSKAPITAEQKKTATPAAPIVAPASGEVLYQYAGSPDLFNAQGVYQPTKPAGATVQQVQTPRPDVKMEADFARLAGKNIGSVPAAPAPTPKPTPAPEPVAKPDPYNGPTVNVNGQDIPQELADSQYFKNLGTDQQEMVGYYWSMQSSGNKENDTKLLDALKVAGAQADPYWKEQINIVKDELSRTIGSLNNDYSATEADLMRRKNEIDADLLYNKDQISTEQAAELAKQKDNIDLQLENVRGEMASRGLTSSSISNQAKERALKESSNVVGSIQRKFADMTRTNELGSARKVTDIQTQIDDLKRKLGESTIDVTRKAEKIVGSDALPNMQGTLGGITGTNLEKEINDILTSANSLRSSNFGIK